MKSLRMPPRGAVGDELERRQHRVEGGCRHGRSVSDQDPRGSLSSQCGEAGVRRFRARTSGRSSGGHSRRIGSTPGVTVSGSEFRLLAARRGPTCCPWPNAPVDDSSVRRCRLWAVRSTPSPWREPLHHCGSLSERAARPVRASCLRPLRRGAGASLDRRADRPARQPGLGRWNDSILRE
jgi:hypothetical protein